ncbi:sulfite exporter TauE/SafE family protein [Candidatus Woesearchaeota archaeon]|nr:sulfite exporter TauE/SafE family protein [Candidatus Woesearchaeota archaeon]
MDAISFVLLLVISFLSAIMGTMVGMAMVIMVPVMVFLGIPVHNAVATGRFSMIGIGVGNIRTFSKREKMKPGYILPLAISGIIGTLAGTSFLKYLSENALENIIGVFIIGISIIVLFEEKLRPKEKRQGITYKHHALSVIAGLFIGSYIGIVGGGAATIIIFVLVLVYGLSFHQAVANQKAVSLPITIIATLVFIYQGLVNYKIGIPLLIVNILGGYVGAILIMKFKPVWLKLILVPISIVLALKLIFF